MGKQGTQGQWSQDASVRRKADEAKAKVDIWTNQIKTSSTAELRPLETKGDIVSTLNKGPGNTMELKAPVPEHLVTGLA